MVWPLWSGNLGALTIPVLALYVGIVLCIAYFAFRFVSKRHLRFVLQSCLFLLLLLAPFYENLVGAYGLAKYCTEFGKIKYFERPKAGSGLYYSSFYDKGTGFDLGKGCDSRCVELLLSQEYPYLESVLRAKVEYNLPYKAGSYRFFLSNSTNSSCGIYYDNINLFSENITRKLAQEKKCLSIVPIEKITASLSFRRTFESLNFFGAKLRVQHFDLLENERTVIAKFSQFTKKLSEFGELMSVYSKQNCGQPIFAHDFKPNTNHQLRH